MAHLTVIEALDEVSQAIKAYVDYTSANISYGDLKNEDDAIVKEDQLKNMLSEVFK